MQLNRRRLFACLAVAPVAAAMPAAAGTHGVLSPQYTRLRLLEEQMSTGWEKFYGGFRAAQREWEAAEGLFTPGKCAGLIIPERADR